MTQTTTEETMFETRIARLEKYLQREGHDITKYDGLPEGAHGSAPTGDTGAGVRASASNSDAAIALILQRDGDRDRDCGSNLTVEETLAIVDLLRQLKATS